MCASSTLGAHATLCRRSASYASISPGSFSVFRPTIPPLALLRDTPSLRGWCWVDEWPPGLISPRVNGSSRTWNPIADRDIPHTRESLQGPLGPRAARRRVGDARARARYRETQARSSIAFQESRWPLCIIETVAPFLFLLLCVSAGPLSRLFLSPFFRQPLGGR